MKVVQVDGGVLNIYKGPRTKEPKECNKIPLVIALHGHCMEGHNSKVRTMNSACTYNVGATEDKNKSKSPK